MTLDQIHVKSVLLCLGYQYAIRAVAASFDVIGVDGFTHAVDKFGTFVVRYHPPMPMSAHVVRLAKLAGYLAEWRSVFPDAQQAEIVEIVLGAIELEPRSDEAELLASCDAGDFDVTWA